MLKGATRRDDFRRRNSNAKVPLLEFADGRYLAESNAIMLYLAEGSSVLPSAGYQRALVYQWLFFEQYSHEPYIAVARSLIHLQGKAEEEAIKISFLHEKGHVALQVMDEHLQQNAWFAGDVFTIADMALYAYTHTAEDGLFKMDGYPAIKRWLGNIERRDDYVEMAHACR